jgi:hypothetical protein
MLQETGLNVFQFQSVIAHTIRPMQVGQRMVPANHPVRLYGYRSDGQLQAEVAFPGTNLVWEFPMSSEDVKKNVNADLGTLKKRVTSVTSMLAEETAVRRVRVLADSLGN